MSDAAVHVVGLGKQYRIGQKRPRRRHLSHSISQGLKSPFVRIGRLLRGDIAGATERAATIWAIKDVSLNIKHGEVVGLIGRNGAGKSTFLKILSRITEPTAGYAEIRGRVGSLLEVGTGFHPELTGRENIYLNGSILGMKRVEVDRKFDEIVAFAEVEQFIDTPVKHYSSGMGLRLAFAVAAHLEPEILLVDEVLAVGDARFQKKCLNKMEDVGHEGRTVLFVSHNMPAITRLCERVILFDGGRLVEDGPAHRVVPVYLNSGIGTMAAREWPEPKEAPGRDVARLRAVRVRADDGQIRDVIDIRRPLALEMEYDVYVPGYVLLPHFHLYNEEAIHVLATLDQDPDWRGRQRPPGRYVSKAWIPGNFLAEGMLFVHASLNTMNPITTQFAVPDAVAFQVIDSLDGDSARGDWAGRLGGVVRPVFEWETRFHANGTEVEGLQRKEVHL